MTEPLPPQNRSPPSTSEQPEFTVTLTEADGHSVLAVCGNVDRHTVPTLATLMIALDSGDKQFVLDLSNATSLDGMQERSAAPA